MKVDLFSYKEIYLSQNFTSFNWYAFYQRRAYGDCSNDVKGL